MISSFRPPDDASELGFADYFEKRAAGATVRRERIALQDFLKVFYIVSGVPSVPGNELLDAFGIELDEFRVQDAVADFDVRGDAQLIWPAINRVDIIFRKGEQEPALPVEQGDFSIEAVVGEAALMLVHFVEAKAEVGSSEEEKCREGGEDGEFLVHCLSIWFFGLLAFPACCVLSRIQYHTNTECK